MVDMKRTKEPTVLTVINLGSASGRDMLSGVFGYVNEGHRWNIRVMQDPHHFTEADVRAGRLVTPGSKLGGLVFKALKKH